MKMLLPPSLANVVGWVVYIRWRADRTAAYIGATRNLRKRIRSAPDGTRMGQELRRGVAYGRYELLSKHPDRAAALRAETMAILALPQAQRVNDKLHAATVRTVVADWTGERTIPALADHLGLTTQRTAYHVRQAAKQGMIPPVVGNRWG